MQLVSLVVDDVVVEMCEDGALATWVASLSSDQLSAVRSYATTIAFRTLASLR